MISEVELNLSTAIVYYPHGHKCDHCEEMNKGMYQVKGKTLCIGCFHRYMGDLALVANPKFIGPFSKLVKGLKSLSLEPKVKDFIFDRPSQSLMPPFPGEKSPPTR